MLGESYLFSAISLAALAQFSPLRKAGSVFTSGCDEKRADIAHTARMSTGGTCPTSSFRMKLGLCSR